MSELDRFVLGTVQLGMTYGISNQTGKPSLDEAQKIIALARSEKIKFIDTADGYGDSADILGKIGISDFNVLSKFIANDSDFLTMLEKSLERLKLKKIWGYSFHRAEQVESFAHWDQVTKAKEMGLINKLGISVYDNGQFTDAIKNPHIDLIQVPFNVLDSWKLRGDLISRASSQGKTVHVRSTFLQGLFFMSPEKIQGNVRALAPLVQEIQSIAKRNNLSVGELCVGYALHFSEIAGLVVGLETLQQLSENVQLFKVNALPKKVIDEIHAIECSNINLLNPANWTKA